MPELTSEWVPGTIYRVVCEASGTRGKPPKVPRSVFDKNKSPLYSLSTNMPMSSTSSDMYLRLKKEKQDRRVRINFGDKLLFIEEVEDMRFRGTDIYYEHYKKVLLGSKVLWLHKTSHHESSTYVRFVKLRA